MKIFRISPSRISRKAPFDLRKFYLVRNAYSNDAKSEIDEDENKSRMWMNSPQGRSQMVKLVSHSLPEHHILPVDMNDYIQQRYGSVSCCNSSEVRILSSLLTFPLTMSLGINQVFGVVPKYPGKLFDLNVLVVGARSEATLPKLWWKETLVCCPTLRHLNLQFMGPHHNLTTSLPSSKNQISGHMDTFQPFTLEWDTLKETQKMIIEDADHQELDDAITPIATCIDDNTLRGTDMLDLDRRRKLTVSNLIGGRCKLHDYTDPDQLLSRIDLFVLFNPGYGSTWLKESWRESMQWLIRSKKPLLCTSHSKYDMSRDLEALETYIRENGLNSTIKSEHLDESAVYDEDSDHHMNNNGLAANSRWYVKPDLNSFRSQRRTFDHREDDLAKIVTTNQHVYSFQIIGE